MEKLASYLDENGLTQTAFAALINVTPSVVSRYLGGKLTPRLAQAIAIEKATSGAVPVAAWGQE